MKRKVAALDLLLTLEQRCGELGDGFGRVGMPDGGAYVQRMERGGTVFSTRALNKR
ncbi:MAG: hypothetical protein ACK6C0_17050 [Betaproteobacteria bacterium]|jgi:hypothetical protein